LQPFAAKLNELNAMKLYLWRHLKASNDKSEGKMGRRKATVKRISS
jgi:hypothetical protein